LAGKSVLARPTRFWEKGIKWAKRQPAAAALLLVTGLATIGFLAGWAWFTAKLHEERATAIHEGLRAQAQEQIAREEHRLAAIERDQALSQRRQAQALLHRLRVIIDEYAVALEMGKIEAILKKDPGHLLFVLARYYALGSAATQQQPDLETNLRRQLTEQFGERAVKLLVKAGDLGYFQNRAHLAQLKNDDDLSSLRVRADFQKLLTDVEKSPAINEPGS
jgi:hypothetical protein